MNILIIFAVIIGFVSTVVFIFILKERSDLGTVKKELDIRALVWAPVSKSLKAFNMVETDYSKLQGDYKRELNTVKSIQRKIAAFDIGLGTIDSVVYEPLMEVQLAFAIEEELNKIKLELKQLLKDKKACVSTKDWWINNRKAEGKKLTNREVKLRLRCFDNVCKSAITLVAWNNISRLLDRLDIRYGDINASGNILGVHLKPKYLDLRKKELKLSFELKEAKLFEKQAELDERRIERAAEKEVKVCKEAFENAKFERELKEKIVAEEMVKLTKLHGQDLDALKLKLAQHQQQLIELKHQEQRALSMAQQTRAGFVYVISNPQSFGKNVCKIGMTRRLEPKDRVKELGDASVPFLFDTHAFIYSEDAPTLEKKLHKIFANKRVNLANYRKEFFFVEPVLVIKEINNIDMPTTVEIFDVDNSTQNAVTASNQQQLSEEAHKSTNLEAVESYVSEADLTYIEEKTTNIKDSSLALLESDPEIILDEENSDNCNSVENEIRSSINSQEISADPSDNEETVEVGHTYPLGNLYCLECDKKLKLDVEIDSDSDEDIDEVVCSHCGEVNDISDCAAENFTDKYLFSVMESGITDYLLGISVETDGHFMLELNNVPEGFSLENSDSEEDGSQKRDSELELDVTGDTCEVTKQKTTTESQLIEDEDVRRIAKAEYPENKKIQEYTYQKQLEGKKFMQKVTDEELKVIAVEEYPDDYDMQRHTYEEQKSAKAFMQKVTDEELKVIAVEEYPDDYDMQRHNYEEQKSAKAFMQKVTDEELKVIAVEEYPDDYDMQRHTYKEQKSAKEFMEKVTDEELKVIAVEEYPDDYDMQRHTYEEQKSAKAFMQKVTDEELKVIAVEEYPDDYDMQKFVYEKES